jgi:hypothetical protein
MLCDILRPFPFSRDGVNTEHASPGGDLVDLPDAIVPGLRAEGYVREAKAFSAAPENRAFASAPENKAGEPDVQSIMSDDELRAFIAQRDGKAPHHLTGRAKLIALAGG